MTYKVCMFALVTLTTLALMCTPSFSHEWYPQDCCSGKDCKQVNAYKEDDVWWLNDGNEWRAVPLQAMRYKPASPDGNSHACIDVTNNIRCFFPGQPKV